MLESIYELIRKEEVVLWIGAGFSKYAGYPMGGELAKILYDNLSLDEQRDVAPSEPFENIAQAYVDFRRDKTYLIEVLRKEYVSRVPISTKYHDQLAKVPHIKSIITTNFDCLLENTFGRNAVLVINDVDIPKIKENKTTIIKAHGDFANENRIVITKNDYANFVQTNLSSPIWSVVIERMLTKSIIFIGYSIEDLNTIALIDKINDALGDNRKEIFFISPSISKRKQSSLELKRIVPIKITGEEFITGLIKNINDNILSDLKKGIVSTDTSNEYLHRNDMYGKLIPTDFGYEYEDLYSKIQPLKYKLSFSLNDKEIASQIQNQNNTDEIIIPKDKLVEFELKCNDLRFPISDLNNIKSISLIQPPEETLTDFIFDNENYNVYNIQTKIYKAVNSVKILFTFNSGSLSLKINIINEKIFDITFQFQRNKIFSRPIDEIQFYKFLYSVFNGEKFYLITQTNKKIELQGTKVNQYDLLDKFLNKIEYFNNLKIIENHFRIIFKDIKQITASNINNVSLIANNIRGNLADYSKEMLMKLSYSEQSDIVVLVNFDKENDLFEVNFKEIETAVIYGFKFILSGKKIIIQEPHYFDLEEVMKKVENKEPTELIIKCKPNSILAKYENIKVQELKNNNNEK